MTASIGASPVGGLSVPLLVLVLLGALTYAVLLMISFRRRVPHRRGVRRHARQAWRPADVRSGAHRVHCGHSTARTRSNRP